MSGVASAAVPVIERSGADLIAKRLCNIPGFQPCAALQSELETDAAAQLTRVIEQTYTGQPPTTVSLPGGRTLTLSAIQMRTPVCNPLSEDQTNRLSQSCGSVCQLTCSNRPDGKMECGMPDYASCTRERAWIRGAYIQMVKNSHKRVRDEVRAQGSLKLSLDCEAPLGHTSYATAQAEYTRLSAELTRLTGQATPSCQGLGDSAADAARSELLPCYLSAVRRTLELVLGEAMVCETLHRADQLWWTERTALNELTRNTVLQVVASDVCRPYYADAPALQSCLNQQYSTQILGAFTRSMQRYSDGI